MTNTNDDLVDFQRKVFVQYELIKGLKKSSNRINESHKEEKKECLFIPFTMVADLIVDKIIERERNKRNYVGNEQEARELLRQKEISDRICETIGNINRREVLTEEKFVNELTAAFYRSDLASRFVMPENAMLYAMLATEVFNIGLEKFCNDKQSN
jgi:hypothetical protein